MACTFLALVAATVWVPIHPRPTYIWIGGDVSGGEIGIAPAPPFEFERIDLVLDATKHGPDDVPDYALSGDTIRMKHPRTHWLMLGIEIGLILAFGGLLALFLRTRAARAAA